jgi:hypothetical protein
MQVRSRPIVSHIRSSQSVAKEPQLEIQLLEFARACPDKGVCPRLPEPATIIIVATTNPSLHAVFVVLTRVREFELT